MELDEKIKAQENSIQKLRGDLQLLVQRSAPSDTLQMASARGSQQALQADIKAQEASLAKMKDELLIISQGATQSARFVDKAVAPDSFDYIASGIPQYLGLSLAASLIAALGVVLMMKRATYR